MDHVKTALALFVFVAGSFFTFFGVSFVSVGVATAVTGSPDFGVIIGLIVGAAAFMGVVGGLISYVSNGGW